MQRRNAGDSCRTNQIILINHSSTHGVSLLRGTPGTTVTITILRGKEQPFDVTLTRKIIKVESVKSKLELSGSAIFASASSAAIPRKDSRRRSPISTTMRTDASGGSCSICATIREGYSAPIKADLIGKDDGAQLKAALHYLEIADKEAARSH